MRKASILSIAFMFFISNLVFAQDYSTLDFDVSQYDKQVWEAKNYLRLDGNHALDRNSKNVFLEYNTHHFVRKNLLDLEIDLSASHYSATAPNKSKSSLTMNKLLQVFADPQKSVEFGKSVKRWGKGYAYSSLAFFEKERNIFYPEFTREGLWLIEGKTFHSFEESIVSSSSFSLLWAPDVKDNESLYNNHKRRGAFKIYALVKETDIDLIVGENLLGADFSTGLTSQLELHGEWGQKNNVESYLAGFRYQSTTDFVLISEFFKDFEQRDFLYLKASQKEPFQILYLTSYVIYNQNLKNNFYRSLLGVNYNFSGRVDLDVALQKTSNDLGAKLLSTFYF